MNDFFLRCLYALYHYKLIRILFTQPIKKEQINDQF